MIKKAIIIAAGRGRRLAPYTDNAPKCLVPVGQASILQRQLFAFQSVGVEEVVLIRGYRGQALQPIAESSSMTVRFYDNDDFANNNVLLSLFTAREELGEPTYVTYSDIIFDLETIKRASESSADIGLVVDEHFRDIYQGRDEHPLEEAEVASIDEQGLVQTVGKTSLPPEQASGEFIGLVRLSRVGSEIFANHWDELYNRFAENIEAPFQRAQTFRNAYLADFLQYLADTNIPLSAIAIQGGWREIDTAQDLHRAEEMVRSSPEQWRHA